MAELGGFQQRREALDVWLSELSRLSPLAPVITENVPYEKKQDTVLVGIGVYGKRVLDAALRRVNSSRLYADKDPSNLSCFWLDVERPNRPVIPVQYRTSLHELILSPDWDDIAHQVAESGNQWAHMRWYRDGSLRSKGRMAIFLDLQSGLGNSQLYQKMCQAVQGLEKPALRIVGPAFGVASGMYVELAHLFHLVVHQRSDVEIWLIGPNKRQSLNEVHGYEQYVQSIATLRELERYQRNGEYSFVYRPDSNYQELKEKVSGAVVQTIIYLDGEGDIEQTLDDIGSQLYCLLDVDTQREFRKFLQTKQVTRVAEYNDRGIVVHTLGIAGLQDNSPEIQQILCWMLIRDVLFNCEYGLLAREYLDFRTGEYQAASLARIDRSEIRQAVDEFLLRYQNRFNEAELAAMIANYANDKLNISPSQAGGKIAQRFQYMLVWLDIARRRLDASEKRMASVFARELRTQLESFAEFLENDVRKWLVERFTDAEAKVQEFDNKTKFSLYPNNYLEIYQKNIFPTDDDSLKYTPVGDMRYRFGFWVRCSYRGNRPLAEMQAIFLPPQPGNVTQANLEQYVLPRAVPGFLASIQVAAEMAVNLGDRLHKKGLSQKHIGYSRWLNAARPKLAYSGIKAEQLLGQLNRPSILFGPGGDSALSVLENIRSMSIKDGPRHFVTIERSGLTDMELLWLEGPIPGAALDSLSAENLAADLPDEEFYYTQRGEQIVCRGEDGAILCSPSFRNKLQENERLLVALAVAFVSGIIERKNGCLAVPGLGELAGATFEKLVDYFCRREGPNPVDDEALAEIENRISHLSTADIQSARHFERYELEAYLKSNSTDTRDCGILLRAVLANWF